MSTDAPALPVGLLAQFYREQARDLPWRNADAGPWGVLVSEFMLQQTPVSRVLPVFRAWLERWPSPAALAADAPGDAIRVWGRLGYPRRALRLHAAATQIVVQHDGVVPWEVDALLALPGVGDYTARAVAAFAHRQRVPVVDTNVRRVLNRIVRGNDDAGPATAADRALLEPLLPAEGVAAAELSAALMELGAMVCTSVRPRCDECPVREHCRWLAVGRPTRTVHAAKQTWHGTDRQVRGRILALLRAAPGAVAADDVVALWPDDAQRERCVSSLLHDGLLARTPESTFVLPG